MSVTVKFYIATTLQNRDFVKKDVLYREGEFFFTSTVSLHFSNSTVYFGKIVRIANGVGYALKQHVRASADLRTLATAALSVLEYTLSFLKIKLSMSLLKIHLKILSNFCVFTRPDFGTLIANESQQSMNYVLVLLLNRNLQPIR